MFMFNLIVMGNILNEHVEVMIQWTSMIYSNPQGVSLATAGIIYEDFL